MKLISVIQLACSQSIMRIVVSGAENGAEWSGLKVYLKSILALITLVFISLLCLCVRAAVRALVSLAVPLVFIARQQHSILMRDIDIANLSVCLSVCLSDRPSVTFRYENGLTYRHSF